MSHPLSLTGNLGKTNKFGVSDSNMLPTTTHQLIEHELKVKQHAYKFKLNWMFKRGQFLSVFGLVGEQSCGHP